MLPDLLKFAISTASTAHRATRGNIVSYTGGHVVAKTEVANDSVNSTHFQGR